MNDVEANGARLPKLGFGTFELDEATAQRMVREAITAGYRHIDTAQMYNNEAAVGAGIREAGIARDDLWLTSKVWVDRFRDGDLQRSVEESLERLGVDALDLMLLHWPNPDVPLRETIGALNDAQRQGLTHYIGVSNFTVALVRQAVEASEAALVTNQVEYHPMLSQEPVMETLRQHRMALTAYCPLGQGKVLRDETIGRIAERHGKHPAQVILRWHYQQPEVVAIPRSSDVEHMKSNLDILDFELSTEEMGKISGLARSDGRIVNPASLAPDWDNAA